MLISRRFSVNKPDPHTNSVGGMLR